ncbi:MAG: methyltransferase domain-containing protein [Candidatus Brevundimonas colombiensis]|uniref:Methyltransferase domain-containing protein n=1 Tax=Candidatus Brevundimonas colombiensis TaxID=3121376 RepID=A0AAJ6BM40_9CAUL|nr:methyltransferase domain-containing protein [Brevundimonas sp.]WEK40311.1 MAG: methyltransferase domain-containing protein [Brevundimonas sp.]
MRRSIDELRTFYGEPTGALARRLVARRLDDAWGEAANCDVLGVGYATPWLDAFVGARRVVAAMPGGQGVEHWPAVGRNRTLLVDDRRLPFAAGSFDRILLVHALEEADDPAALLLEAVRALAPTGRIILAAAARGGLWARADNTPFGHGRPFTRRQLERLVRDVGLEPMAWSQTLYAPPWGPMLPLADGFEQVGRHVFPGTAGLILLEATRQGYARIRPSGHAQRVTAPVLTPQPAASISSRRKPYS